MRTSGASVRFAFVLALGACSSGADLVEDLAAPDPELAAHVRARDGVWQNGTSPGWRSAQMGPFYDVGARLPQTADGAVEVGIGQSEDFRVRLVPEAANAALFEDDAGRAMYREAWEKTDLVFVATAKRLEWLLVLADAHAPTSFRWRVALPPKLPTLRRDASSAFVFADEGGTSRLRIPVPYALDARGNRRDAQIDYTDGR